MTISAHLRRETPVHGPNGRTSPVAQPGHPHVQRTQRSDDRLERLTEREREVLALMAQGRSNGAIARLVYLSYGAVEKNVASIFSKLELTPDTADHRRVLAVLRYLGRDTGR
ncbi:response regulator transcription factor [Cellulomonas sp. APG4]|nr:response regulator transcription factor [Cellulomonas sp. APG4]